MPIKSTNIDISKVNEPEVSENELRKQALRQIVKDSRYISRIMMKVFFGFVFLYGFISILQDVNLI